MDGNGHGIGDGRSANAPAGATKGAHDAADRLGLRLRIFLFFCLLGLGSIAILAVALYLGFRQLGQPEALPAFVSAGLIAGFGGLALATGIWMLFDDNVAKPLERLAADMRVRAHGGVRSDIDAAHARYLGDLAPAAAALNEQLAEAADTADETVAQRTERLTRERDQLLMLLSDLPVAVMVVNAADQIVLYDGQARALMASEAPMRLNGSLFDYLEETPIRAALAAMDGPQRREIAAKGRSGRPYAGHIRRLSGDQGYTLMLEPLDPDAQRPMVYDFDLLERRTAGPIDAIPLRALDYVVFDSETTGLDPQTDAVVQLAAVRVVNGQIVEGESYETLVDPGRPIPPSATRVHGVTDAMCAGAPTFDAVCTAFYDYAKGAVLVAHNAPFDMAFLHGQGARCDLRFDHPVLDTVLLSAIVYGDAAEHTLDTVCERLSIAIPDGQRHTALGDALATAHALAHLLPILTAKGFETYGQVAQEMSRHQRILRAAGG